MERRNPREPRSHEQQNGLWPLMYTCDLRMPRTPLARHVMYTRYWTGMRDGRKRQGQERWRKTKGGSKSKWEERIVSEWRSDMRSVVATGDFPLISLVVIGTSFYSLQNGDTHCMEVTHYSIPDANVFSVAISMRLPMIHLYTTPFAITNVRWCNKTHTSWMMYMCDDTDEEDLLGSNFV